MANVVKSCLIHQERYVTQLFDLKVEPIGFGHATRSDTPRLEARRKVTSPFT